MSTPADPTAPSTAPAKKPTAWIIATVVAALVAVGLLIWGLSTKSDLDSANKTIKQQQTVIDTATKDAQAAVGIENKQVKQYDRVRGKLVKTKLTAAQQRREIAVQKSQVVTAQQQLDAARGRNAKLAAEANLAKQQLDVAQACAQGTIRAIDSVFTAPTPKAGVNRLNNDLAALSKDCQEQVG